MGRERAALKRVLRKIPIALRDGAVEAAKIPPRATFALTFLQELHYACHGLRRTDRAAAAEQARKATDRQLIAGLEHIGANVQRNQKMILQLVRAFFDLVAQNKGELTVREETIEQLSRLDTLPADVRATLADHLAKIRFGVADPRRGVRRMMYLIDSIIAKTLDPRWEAFERDYLDFIAGTFNRMRFFGVRHLKDVRQSLSVAYLPLRLRRPARDDHPIFYQAEDEPLIWPRLTIRGPAGCGKTTLLHWIALQCGDRDRQDNPWAGRVPFLVPLRQVTRGQPDAARLLAYTADPKVFLKKPPDGWMATVLRHHRAIVMFDGVDELPPRDRPRFWQWLDDFVNTHGDNHFIVTSRPFPDPKAEGTGRRSDHLWAPPSDFTPSRVDEMTDTEIEEFITKWHEAVLANEDEPQERASIEAARDRLPRTLEDPAAHRVRELCRTPLLCALVCALHWREEGYLPAKRTDLYDRCCAMLIEERDRKRQIPLPDSPVRFLTRDDKEMVLQKLALDMMPNKAGAADRDYHIEISREETLRWVKGRLSAFDDERARKCSPQQVIDHLITRTSLLREPRAGQIAFCHRVVQEYLAACAAGVDYQAGDLAKQAGDDQWGETIILAAGTTAGGIKFGHEVINELLARGARSRAPARKKACYALAIACLETAEQIDAKLRERVLRHLNAVFPPLDFEEAQAVAAAGNAVLPRLRYRTWRRRKRTIVAACVRTLSLIGGQQATRLLTADDGYIADTRNAVLAELCRCRDLEPLAIPAILKVVSGSGRIPDFAQPHLKDLSPLAETADLQRLDLSKCPALSDLTPLSGLTALQTLGLLGTAVTDLRPLSALTGLHWLDLEATPVSDLTPLSGLAGLQALDLSRTQVSDLRPLSCLTGLRRLILWNTQIPDLSPLSALTGLQSLELDDAQVRDLTPLSGLTGLRWLALWGAQVSDLTPLSDLTGLQYLDLGRTQVSDLTPLSGLTGLRELWLNGTPVTDLSPLPGLTSLQKLDLTGTPVTDLEPVKHLPNLEILGP